MAFEIKNFTPIGGQARGGNAPAHWSYQSSADSLSTVLVVNYFAEVGTQVSPGDFIYVSLSNGRSILTVSSTILNPPGVAIDVNVISGTVQSFAPNNLTDLVLWLDGADASTIIDTAGAVSSWNDKSGNGNNAVQLVSASQPMTGVVDINGVNAIAWDTVDDLLTIPSDPSLSGIWAKGGTLFMVVRSKSSGGNGSNFGRYFDHIPEWRLNKATGDSQLDLNVKFSITDGSFRSDNVFGGGAPTVVGITYDGSDVSNAPTAYKDGALLAGMGPITTPVGTIQVELDDFHVGNREDLAKSIDSDIGEVLIYKRLLPDTEISAVHAYLSNKWGIPLA